VVRRARISQILTTPTWACQPFQRHRPAQARCSGGSWRR
jgi:hypothetical protein